MAGHYNMEKEDWEVDEHLICPRTRTANTTTTGKNALGEEDCPGCRAHRIRQSRFNPLGLDDSDGRHLRASWRRNCRTEDLDQDRARYASQPYVVDPDEAALYRFLHRLWATKRVTRRLLLPLLQPLINQYVWTEGLSEPVCLSSRLLSTFGYYLVDKAMDTLPLCKPSYEDDFKASWQYYMELLELQEAAATAPLRHWYEENGLAFIPPAILVPLDVPPTTTTAATNNNH